ncbi:tryptophan transporter [Treponema sp.]|uniref:tryptophan transporter n=1 Tax=Treponema sp. TaxID=166 RepID=UPI003EFFA536
MNENENLGEKRVLVSEEKKGLQVQDLILVAVLLAAGAVLKFFVGSIINIGGMKPNFIIAMYCMAIALTKPGIKSAAVIGILAGAICQFFPGTPYLNFASEIAGAVVMALLMKLPVPQLGKLDFKPALSTLASTIVSGGIFTVLLIFALGADKGTLVAYIPIVLCTACINAVLVQVLFIPLKMTLK